LLLNGLLLRPLAELLLRRLLDRLLGRWLWARLPRRHRLRCGCGRLLGSLLCRSSLALSAGRGSHRGGRLLCERALLAELRGRSPLSVRELLSCRELLL